MSKKVIIYRIGTTETARNAEVSLENGALIVETAKNRTIYASGRWTVVSEEK